MLRYLEAFDWAFFRTTTYCYTTVGDTENRLFVGYNQEYDQVHIGFWSSAAPDAADRSNVAFSMTIWKRLSNGARAARSPQLPTPMVAYRNNINKTVYNVLSDGRAAITSLSEGDRIEFHSSSGADVGTFSLRGSANALRRLETCTPR